MGLGNSVVCYTRPCGPKSSLSEWWKRIQLCTGLHSRAHAVRVRPLDARLNHRYFKYSYQRVCMHSWTHKYKRGVPSF